MKYVGLNICEENNLKYSRKFFNTDIVSIKPNKVSNIVSLLIDSYILDTSYVNSMNCIKVSLESKVKILYSTDSSTDLYSFEKTYPTIEYINIDKYIDGNQVNSIFVQTKVKPELYIDNMYCTIMDESSILFTYYNVINLKISPSFYVCYYIKNGLSNNIFTSYIDGSGLTQRTFDNFFTYSNIVYNSASSKLAFIGTVKNQSLIYHTDAKSKASSTVNCISNFKTVESFCFYNKNKLIISLANDINFYIYDLNKKELSKLKTPTITNTYSNVKYSAKYNRIFFIYNINNITCLASLNKSLNLEIIYNENTVDYVINDKSDKILIKSIIDNIEIINLFYINHDIYNQVLLNFEYDNIIKFDFLYEDNFEYILILYNHNNHNYITKYNINTFTHIDLCTDYYINDFYIDNNTNDLFICYKGEGLSKVIRIYNNQEDEIFQSANNIKSICVKE